MGEQAGGPGTRRERFPVTVQPMMAVAGPLPADEDSYGAELKWDGVRAAAHVRDGTVRLMSRNLREMTGSYPDLALLAGLLPGRAVVLDGEIVALDPAGRPDFGVLQARMHVREPTPRLLASVPVCYYIFDVLHLDGWSTLDLPYTDRRDLLDQLGVDDPQARIPPHFPGAATAALHTARELGLEGVVCKRLTSRYLPGRRSALWRKTKITATQEVVIGGWKPGAGRRTGLIGSLLLGLPDPRGLLRYVGGVGTGFTDAALRDLARHLEPLTRPTSPFTDLPAAEARTAHWVEPQLVGEVEYAHWTTDGYLRHPSWRGLRPDKTPHDVQREPRA
jgi:bifunctional non-homologous end joining protein LigD